jgi:hypothetical protein
MKKTIFFVVLAFVGFVTLGLIAFFLFGHLEMNGECKFKGPLSQVNAGSCAGNSNASGNQYEGRYADDLEFNIPDNYFLNEEEAESEEAEISFIFSKNPEEIEDGEFAPNLNIIKSGDYIEFNENICSELLSSSIEQLTPYYETLTNGDSAIENLSGVDSCVTQWEGTLSGINLFQKQYAVPHKDRQVVYYFTLTTNSELEELESLENIVKDVKLK